jgi:hypothetical protein
MFLDARELVPPTIYLLIIALRATSPLTSHVTHKMRGRLFTEYAGHSAGVERQLLAPSRRPAVILNGRYLRIVLKNSKNEPPQKSRQIR